MKQRNFDLPLDKWPATGSNMERSNSDVESSALDEGNRLAMGTPAITSGADKRETEALLLDFGGVIFRGGIKREDGVDLLTESVSKVLKKEGAPLPYDRVREDVELGRGAYKNWKRSENRRYAPREIRHEEFWGDFVAGKWPAASRVAVIRYASSLMEDLQIGMKIKKIKDGIPEALAAAKDAGLKVGIVSNTLCGLANRKTLNENGLLTYIDGHVYSDEVGVRKPNPLAFDLAAETLDVDLSKCWYVGDQHDRDVIGGRRAGVGFVVVMKEDERGETPMNAEHQPDVTIKDGWELKGLLEEHVHALVGT